MDSRFGPSLAIRSSTHLGRQGWLALVGCRFSSVAPWVGRTSISRMKTCNAVPCFCQLWLKLTKFCHETVILKRQDEQRWVQVVALKDGLTPGANSKASATV